MENELTLKQEIFCQTWVDTTGNGTHAALSAFDIENKELLDISPDKRTDEEKILCDIAYKIASSMGTEYLRKPSIIKRIDEILESRGFNDDAVKREHFKLLAGAKDEVRMRAIDSYYKLKGKIVDKSEIKHNVNVIKMDESILDKYVKPERPEEMPDNLR
jgi:hypothetical protein